MSEKLNPEFGGLTFDEWVKLAESDPLRFEVKRLEAAVECIASAPESQRRSLEQLQFRINALRVKSRKCPLVSAEILHNEMMMSVQSLAEKLRELEVLLSPQRTGLRSVK